MKATDRDTPRPPRARALPAPLLLAALAGVVLVGSAALAQAPSPFPLKAERNVVADVRVVGNRRVSADRILREVKTRPGADYNQHTANDDVRKLIQTGLFRNVRVDLKDEQEGRVLVFFTVTELDNTVQEIEYRGARHASAEELNTLTGLRKGGLLNPVTNKIACQQIVRRYQEQGRLLATCELLEGGSPGDTRVVFNITEGPEVYLGGVAFTGNHFVGAGRLATQVNSKGPFPGGLLAAKYNPVIVEFDVAKLEEYYKSFGYLDVKVSRDLTWSADQRYVYLTFHIDEGQRYQVAETQVDGASKVPPVELEALVKTRKGEFYNKQQVDSDVETIRAWYGYKGMGVGVRDEAFFPGQGFVKVHYQVQERPPASVGQIFIVGNEVTRQNVILRQVPLFPGQILSFPDLRVAERNLAQLQIFETNQETGVRPTVTVLDPEGDNPVKDVLVTVQEARTGSLLFGLGVNSDAGLTGSIVLNERNFDLFRPPTSFEDLLSGKAFRGAGQEFRLEAVPGTQLQRYTFNFREPFLFDSPYSLSVGGYYYTRIFDEYTERRLGSRITLGRRLDRFWTVSGGLRVENVRVENFPFFAPPDFFAVAGDNFLLGLRAGLNRDTRDSFLRPSAGNLLDFSFEQITGDQTYPLVNLEANQYFTTYQRPDGSGKHVLSLRSQLGYAGANAPVFERFYAGGFRSIRGFEFRGIGPEVGGFKVGGDFLFLNSLEYQVPVLANDQFFVVGFLDTGTVERRVDIKDYRVTAGFGFRFVVPQLGPVPIALDFGFPVRKGPFDDERVFSFFLGIY